jgi:hypothetical protein
VEIIGQLPQHRGVAIDRADRHALRVGERGQAVIGAEDVGRAIDQVEVLPGTVGAVHRGGVPACAAERKVQEAGCGGNGSPLVQGGLSHTLPTKKAFLLRAMHGERHFMFVLCLQGNELPIN